jgi:hypothetical protein
MGAPLYYAPNSLNATASTSSDNNEESATKPKRKRNPNNHISLAVNATPKEWHPIILLTSVAAVKAPTPVRLQNDININQSLNYADVCTQHWQKEDSVNVLLKEKTFIVNQCAPYDSINFIHMEEWPFQLLLNYATITVLTLLVYSLYKWYVEKVCWFELSGIHITNSMSNKGRT